jgi:hypothetical protein
MIFLRYSKVKQDNRSLSLLVSQEVGGLKLKNVPRNTKKKHKFDESSILKLNKTCTPSVTTLLYFIISKVISFEYGTLNTTGCPVISVDNTKVQPIYFVIKATNINPGVVYFTNNSYQMI